MILRKADKQKRRLVIVIPCTVSVTMGKCVNFTQCGKGWRWGVQERKIRIQELRKAYWRKSP